MALPARRERLRENQESNKENDGQFSSVTDHYIEELTGEGYEHAAVLKALNISKNNLRMAREILETFAKKD